MTGLILFSTEVEFTITLLVFVGLCVFLYLSESSR